MAVLLPAGKVSGDLQTCHAKNDCTLCGAHTGTFTSTRSGGKFTVCPAGVNVTGAYILAAHERVLGGPTTGVFTGDIVISAQGGTLQNLDVDGAVRVVGADCSKTEISNVSASGGVSARPSGRGLINLEGSTFSNIVESSGQRYPLGIAHATGRVAVTCAPGTSVVVQPADSTVGFVLDAPTCTDPAVLDLNVVFAVFGTDLERVEFHATPAPPSLFLTTYWHTALAVTIVGIFIKYVGRDD